MQDFDRVDQAYVYIRYVIAPLGRVSSLNAGLPRASERCGSNPARSARDPETRSISGRSLAETVPCPEGGSPALV